MGLIINIFLATIINTAMATVAWMRYRQKREAWLFIAVIAVRMLLALTNNVIIPTLNPAIQPYGFITAIALRWLLLPLLQLSLFLFFASLYAPNLWRNPFHVRAILLGYSMVAILSVVNVFQIGTQMIALFGQPIAEQLRPYFLFVLLFMWGWTPLIGLLGIAFISQHSERRALAILLMAVLSGILISLSVSQRNSLSNLTTILLDILITAALGYLLLRRRVFETAKVAIDRALEGMIEGIVVLDANRRVLFVNRAMQQYIKLPVGTWLEDARTKTFDPESLRPVLERERHVLELTLDNRSIVVRGTPIIDETEQLQGHLLLAHDVSEARTHQRAIEEHNTALQQSLKRQHQLMEELIAGRQAEEAAYRAKAAAEAANQAKSEFLSRMSHELRTPLNAILGFAQLLELQELTPLQRKNVGAILKSGQLLLDLINEVLNIARIEAGQLPLSVEPVSVHAIVEDIIEVAQPLAHQRQITLEDRTTECPWVVYADHQRLRQVLLNLTSNAIKYNQVGGTVTILCAPESEQRLRVEVRDTGRGIAPADLPLLFTPFTRVGAEQTTVEGVGLGLALSKRLVEAMQGDIGVESTLGEGSTFWFTLPMIDTRPAASINQTTTFPQVSQSIDYTGTLLYIEDQSSNIALVEQIIEHYPDIQLLTAVRGKEGLELALAQHPDLILLDLHLPDIDGAQVIQHLRENIQTQNIPVVVVSADATASRIQHLLEAGAHTYLTKPLDIGQLLRVIKEIFSAHLRTQDNTIAQATEVFNHENIDRR